MLSLLATALLAIVPVQTASTDVHLSPRGRSVGVLASAVSGMGCIRCRLVTAPVKSVVLAQNGADVQTPPPLLPADPYEQTPPPPPPPPNDVPDYNKVPPEQQQQNGIPPPQTKLRTDPHAGDWVGGEALVGGLTLFGADVVAALAIVGITLATLTTGNSTGTVGAGVVLIVGAILIHGLLSPLYCALAEKAFADEPTNSGLVGAAIGAYAASFTLGAIIVVMDIVVSLAASGGSTAATSSAATALSLIVSLVALVGRYVGVPIATSYGMHFGNAPVQQNYAEAEDPRPYRWITRVSKFGVEELPLRAPTAFSF